MAVKNMIFTEDEARCIVEVLKEKSSAIHDVLQKVNGCGWWAGKTLKQAETARDAVKLAISMFCCDFYVLSLKDFFQLVCACFVCRQQLSDVCVLPSAIPWAG